MKYLLIVASLFLATVARAENYVLDSDFISNVPSVRATAVFGQDFENLFQETRPASGIARYASFAAEYALSYEYILSVHELGHGIVGKYYGCKVRFDNDTCWWKNAFTRRLAPNTYYWGHLNEKQEAFAGLNATTTFVEFNPHSNIVIDTYGRLSELIYILGGRTDPLSDNVTLQRLGYNVSKEQFCAAQIAAMVFSKLQTTQVYAYLNTDGLSLRAVRDVKGYHVAVESLLVRNHYNCEVAVSHSFEIGKVTLTPELTASLHGFNYNVAVSYDRFTVGYRSPNMNTLSGAREMNKEVYAQAAFRW